MALRLPLLSTLIIAGAVVCHVTEFVTSCVLPSLYTAVAVSWRFVPFASVGFCGRSVTCVNDSVFPPLPTDEDPPQLVKTTNEDNTPSMGRIQMAGFRPIR